jgi:hypothetical protein
MHAHIALLASATLASLAADMADAIQLATPLDLSLSLIPRCPHWLGIPPFATPFTHTFRVPPRYRCATSIIYTRFPPYKIVKNSC